jgi:Zn finger protein HypA/HybF involved in hydrogenase expression
MEESMETIKEKSPLQNPHNTGHAVATNIGQAGVAEAFAATAKTVSQIRATKASCDCPHCGAESYGWLADPRGRVTTCDECNQDFTIAADATVSIT